MHSLTEDFLRTVYILTHFTRAFFAIDWYEEFLVWFGNGKNGKDMLQTWMRVIFGEYAQVLDAATLCVTIDPAKPQPTLRRTYAKRFVYCSEVPADARFCVDTFKKLRDQRGAPITA
eukprot:6817955-Alexandrium_andersonii.AAC.1